MNNLGICDKCDKKTVVSQYFTLNILGEQARGTTCLNCGWFVNKAYLPNEELEGLRKNHEQEIRENNLKLKEVEEL